METLDRVQTARGELVLRRDGERFEIISNGVFLMDTSDGVSERLLVEAALDRCRFGAARLLIGGLGVGFSLVRAVSDGRVAAVDVVEIESAIIGWHRGHLAPLTEDAIRDPRVSIIEADLLAYLSACDATYDAICLDTDNGPNWLVFESNAGLYDASGLDLAAAALRPGGVLAVWSSSRDQEFEERLHNRFRSVELLEVPRDRGEPDIVYIGRG